MQGPANNMAKAALRWAATATGAGRCTHVKLPAELGMIGWTQYRNPKVATPDTKQRLIRAAERPGAE